MAFNAYVFGELEVGEAQLENWLVSDTQQDSQHWPEFFGTEGKPPRSPEVLLEELRQLAIQPDEFLGVGLEGGKVSVRAMLKQESLLEAAQALGALFDSATAAGGQGRLIVVGRQGVSFGYDVEVCCGAVRARPMPQAEMEAFLSSRACAEMIAREYQNLEGLLGTRPEETLLGFRHLSPFLPEPEVAPAQGSATASAHVNFE